MQKTVRVNTSNGQIQLRTFTLFTEADLIEMRLMRERGEHARLMYLRNKFAHLLRPRGGEGKC
jgi:hypothetical protein